MDDVEEFLEHFGVKGMHWGIRNNKFRARATRQKEQHKERLERAKSGTATKKDKSLTRLYRYRRANEVALAAAVLGGVGAALVSSLNRDITKTGSEFTRHMLLDALRGGH